jgi:hypothetical protein
MQRAKKLNYKRTNNPINNELIKQFSEEGIQMASKYMKQCSAFLAIKEMQIRATQRFNFTPVRLVIIEKTDNKGW